MIPVAFTVDGRPAPQGSKRHVGKGRMIESSKGVKPWRAAVEAAARRFIHEYEMAYQQPWEPLDGPLYARMVFTLPRPKRPTSQRPDRTPDLSKLLRSTEDALTDARLWTDDARVVEYSRAAKLYAGDRDVEAGVLPGAFIVVYTKETR